MQAGLNSFFSGLLERSQTLFVVLCVALIVVALAVIVYVLLRRSPSKGQGGTAPDALIGRDAVVRETVDGDSGTGLVEIDGNGWAARPVFVDDVYQVGDTVTIVAVEGVKLIVRRDA